MSIAPSSGRGASPVSAISRASRSASGTPAVRMPTNTKGSGPTLRSMISCAMRLSARPIPAGSSSSRFSTRSLSKPRRDSRLWSRNSQLQMPSAGIILIGDEILSGKVVDENARFLIEELRELGVALRRVIVIPDVLDEIAGTVREFAARFDHVFTSGGVGPTHDDLTMDGVAMAFGEKVIRHPELERLLRGYYGERLEERNLRMA